MTKSLIRQAELNGLAVRVEEQQEAVIGYLFAAAVNSKERAVDKDAQRPRVANLPILIRHFFAGGLEPRAIINVDPVKWAALEPVAAAKSRIEPGQRSCKYIARPLRTRW